MPAQDEKEENKYVLHENVQRNLVCFGLRRLVFRAGSFRGSSLRWSSTNTGFSWVSIWFSTHQACDVSDTSIMASLGFGPHNPFQLGTRPRPGEKAAINPPCVRFAVHSQTNKSLDLKKGRNRLAIRGKQITPSCPIPKKHDVRQNNELCLVVFPFTIRAFV